MKIDFQQPLCSLCVTLPKCVYVCVSKLIWKQIIYWGKCLIPTVFIYLSLSLLHSTQMLFIRLQKSKVLLLICLDSWATGEWGACSRSCGGGQQTRPLRCLRKVTYQREEVVAHSLCPIVSPAQIQPCQTQACLPEWSTGSWSQVGLWVCQWRRQQKVVFRCSTRTV